MSKPFTVSVGPAVQVLHSDPHFDADGDCLCECPACSEVFQSGTFIVMSECICPDCPCAP